MYYNNFIPIFKDTVSHIKSRHSSFYRAVDVAQEQADERERLIEIGREEERTTNAEIISEFQTYVRAIPQECRDEHIPIPPPRLGEIQRPVPDDSQEFDNILENAFAVFDAN